MHSNFLINYDYVLRELRIENYTLRIIAAVLILAGLWQCGLGWAQLAGLANSGHALYPATGTFFNPGPFCAFLGVIMPVALFTAMRGEWKWARLVAIVYIIAAVGLMPVLMGRTGWIAAIAGCVVVYFGVKPLRSPSWLIIVAALIIIIGALIGLYYLKTDSASGRLLLWKIGMLAMLESPLTGVGWDNVAGALGRAQEEYFAVFPYSAEGAVAGSPEYAFNEYIQIGVAFGFPAMLLFFAALANVIFAAWFSDRYGLAGVATAFAVACFGSYPLQFRMFIFVAALIAVAHIMTEVWRRWLKCTLLVLTGIIAIGVATSISRRDRVVESWRTLRYAYMHELTDHDVAVLDSLGSQCGYYRNTAFIFDYGKALRDSRRFEKSTEVLELGVERSSDPMFLNLIGRNYEDRGDYYHAIKYYNRSINRLPRRLYPYYRLCKASVNFYDRERFFAASSRMLAVTPKVESTATRQMREEITHMRDSVNARIKQEKAQEEANRTPFILLEKWTSDISHFPR